MEIPRLRRLYQFNEWANARCFAALEQCREDELAQPIASSFPTLLDTMAHIVSSEWIWLERWQGRNPTDVPAWHDRPTLASLREELARVEAGRQPLLDGLHEAGLEEPLAYRQISGAAHETPLVELLIHVVNHSSYHRGQLATQLRQLGREPVGTDYLLFVREG